MTPVAMRPKSEDFLPLAGAQPLNVEDTALQRSGTIRVNYLTQDRPDLSFAAGSLARGMKSPTTKDLEELQHVGRYVRGRPSGAIVFEPQTWPGVLEVFWCRPCWRLGNAKIPIWNGSHVGSVFDQARECSAKHHRTEQWRVRILRVAQVVGPTRSEPKQC